MKCEAKHATCMRGSPCKLHVSQPSDLLLRRRGDGLIHAPGFIHRRLRDLAGYPFQSITEGETLQASSSASDTDGGGTECVQTF